MTEEQVVLAIVEFDVGFLAGWAMAVLWGTRP